METATAAMETATSGVEARLPAGGESVRDTAMIESAECAGMGAERRAGGKSAVSCPAVIEFGATESRVTQACAICAREPGVTRTSVVEPCVIDACMAESAPAIKAIVTAKMSVPIKCRAGGMVAVVVVR
jgi:hypothetical protein